MIRKPKIKFSFLRLLGLVIIATALMTNLGPAKADEITDAINSNQTINNKKKEILLLQSQIADQKLKIKQLQSQAKTLKDQANLLDAEMTDTQQEMNLAQVQLDQVNSDIADVTKQIADTQTKLDAQVLMFKDNINESYIMSQTSFFDVIAETQSMSDMVKRLEYNQIVDDQNQEILTSIQTLKQTLLDQKTALEDKKKNVEQLQADIQQKEFQLQFQKNTKQSMLAETQGLENKYQSLLQDNLQAEQSDQAQINATMDKIAADIRAKQEAARQAQIAAGKTPSTSVTPSRKGYIWPTKGTITMRFWQSYPDWMINAYPFLKIGNNRYHTGIDIANSIGTPILAPKSGTVVNIQHYGKYSYGNMAMIDHGDGAVTVYGHMSEISVSMGQHVAQGQQIGLMGCSGFCTGPHLHFEIREVTASSYTLVDPMLYLP